METYKRVYIVIGYINKTNEIEILYETDTPKKANEYKKKYEDRISIYNSFEVIEELYPNKFNSYKDYTKNKYKNK